MMKLELSGLAIAALMMFGSHAVLAQDSSRVAVSGVVAAVTDTEVDVTTTDGSKVAVKLGDKTRYTWTMAMSIDDIKAGSYIGAGAMSDGKGGNTAVEITVFPESARGAAEGFRQWNQGPDSTMTNGTVSQVVGTSNRTLTVTYNGGQQAVTIPDGTPITTFETADKTALTVGAHVTVRALKADDGTLTAGFVSVGKDGYVPKG
jgi:hypothetical protein